MASVGIRSLSLCKSLDLEYSEALCAKLRPVKVSVFNFTCKKLRISGGDTRSNFLEPIKAMDASKTTSDVNGGCNAIDDFLTTDCDGFPGYFSALLCSNFLMEGDFFFPDLFRF